MASFQKRDAISCAQFFLNRAEECDISERYAFECYLEAAIVFGRAAIHRLPKDWKKHPDWNDWFDKLKTNDAVKFFRSERDWILKEGPPKLGQIISLSPNKRKAKELYYFETPAKPASEIVRDHLESICHIIEDGKAKFSSSSAT
jgi:hypothetical protein